MSRDYIQDLNGIVSFMRAQLRLPPQLVDAIRNAEIHAAKFMDAARRYPPVLQEAIITLADEGWYLDWTGMHINEPVELVEMYSKGNREEVEARLIKHYRDRVPAIDAELRELFPSRAHILDQAFAAHRQGNFYLSVPTFLAQADGIYFEFQGKNFFITKEAKGKFSTDTKDQDDLTKALLAPFSNSTSIRKTAKERETDFIYLNRHVVMHGESLDYGTEVKSLQAVALLYYVAVSLGRVLKRQATEASE